MEGKVVDTRGRCRCAKGGAAIGHGGEFEQPLQIPFGPVFGDEAVQTRLLFPE